VASPSMVDRQETKAQGNPPWPSARGAEARYLGHQNLIHFFLHDLGNEVKLFCSPSVAAMVHERLAMAARFGRWLVAVMVATGEALAPGMAPAVTVMTGGPPPSNNSAQGARFVGLSA
jgi:hypothetical protein